MYVLEIKLIGTLVTFIINLLICIEKLVIGILESGLIGILESG